MNALLKSINLAGLAVLFAACVSLTSYEPSDAFVRTVDRVLDRHDLYVATDPALDEEEVAMLLGESDVIRALLDGVDVELDRALLLSELSPILARYDAFIEATRASTTPKGVSTLSQVVESGRF